MLRASCVETHPCETGLALGFLFPSQYWTLSQNDISLTQTHTQSHHYPRPTFPVSSCVQGPCMKLSFLQFESHKAQSVCSLSSDGRVEQLTWLKGIGRLFCCVLNYGWITTWLMRLDIIKEDLPHEPPLPTIESICQALTSYTVTDFDIVSFVLPWELWNIIERNDQTWLLAGPTLRIHD